VSQKPRILDELGKELDRAARRTLVGKSTRRSTLGRWAEVAALAVALAVVVAVAVVALGGLHPRHHVPASSGGSTGKRGVIIDAEGNVLVSSLRAPYVEIDPSRLAQASAARTAERRRLGRLLRVGHQPLPTSHSVSVPVAKYLSTHEAGFQGVTVRSRYLRTYPLHELAAQLFGTVGPITPPELREPRFEGVSRSATVGQSGLEWYYDSSLRAGNNLKLSLDTNLEQAATRALQHAIDANPPASGGAFVAMNPDNGAVYAMGSLPTYDPSIFTRPVSNSAYRQLTNPAADYPLIDRAIQSAGPIGSTFKPITATAALESGAWGVGTTYDDTGQFCLDGQCRRNPGGAANGVLDLVNAIRVSDDVFFYNLGALTNADPTTHPNGGALQQWASALGIGRPTGIDLGGEVAGNLPTPKWGARVNQLEAECDAATGPFKGRPKHSPGGCGIAGGINRPWSVGDNINLAVGQGAVQVTPLQLAVAYSAIANGGAIVRPHVGEDIQRPEGTVLQQVAPSPTSHLRISPQYLDAIRRGLRDATSQKGGTSADVFKGFPEPVYGEAGSAQYNGHHDYAWYAGFVPATATSKPIVVVVTVQQGGFGAHAAAPVARQILSQWLLGRTGAWVPGSSKTL
jgi:penicillin-binding protein 2